MFELDTKDVIVLFIVVVIVVGATQLPKLLRSRTKRQNKHMVKKDRH